MYRTDVLAHAYDCCLANKGAAGVDGQTFEDIQEHGLDRPLAASPFPPPQRSEEWIASVAPQWQGTSAHLSLPAGAVRFVAVH